jgi:hypothetical protein
MEEPKEEAEERRNSGKEDSAPRFTRARAKQSLQSSPVETTESFELLMTEENTKLGFKPSNKPPHPIFVVQVEKGSWADLGGVVCDDQLMSCNGTPIEQLDPDDLVKIMRVRPLRLVFSRSKPADSEAVDRDSYFYTPSDSSISRRAELTAFQSDNSSPPWTAPPASAAVVADSVSTISPVGKSPSDSLRAALFGEEVDAEAAVESRTVDNSEMVANEAPSEQLTLLVAPDNEEGASEIWKLVDDATLVDEADQSLAVPSEETSGKSRKSAYHGLGDEATTAGSDSGNVPSSPSSARANKAAESSPRTSAVEVGT